MERKDLKIVFFGTPEFAVESLETLVDNGYNVVAVVTMPDKQAGRGHKMIQSAVKQYALTKDIPVLQPEKLKNPEFVEALRSFNADLFIVIAFRMLPEVVWTMPPLGTFNLHASLLPKYRGAAPINRAIMNGETRTGVTTFFLKHEIDTGDMIMQCAIDIAPEDNAGTVHDKLMHLGSEMVLKTVSDIFAGNVKTEPQPDGEFTSAPKIFKEDCKIDWNNSSEQIHNLIRGLSPYPAAYAIMTDENGKETDVKIFESRIIPKINIVPDTSRIIEPGKVVIEKKQLYIGCGEGLIEILELQPAGKKRMSAEAFLLGYHPVNFS